MATSDERSPGVKAALYERHGAAAEVLRVTDIERPDPGPGEVRVRVEVSGVNPTDWKLRSGATPQAIDRFQIPHHDGAGVIDAVGAGVSQERLGQRVWTWLAAAGRPWGTAAEWTVIPQRQAVPLPEGVSPELGASLGVPAMTAYWCLYADGPLTGQTVLVAGGAGAVGHCAIELAKHGGARVIATVSGPAKAELAARAGADLVVNYRDVDAAERIASFAGAVDRVIEVALGANVRLDLAVARPGASIVTYAAEASDPVLPVRACMTANVTMKFVLLYTVPTSELERAAHGITRALRDGALSELPVRRFALGDIAAAHDAVQAGEVGKVVVIPA
jgi:NADPH2:quinone reductase